MSVVDCYGAEMTASTLIDKVANLLSASGVIKCSGEATR